MRLFAILSLVSALFAVPAQAATQFSSDTTTDYVTAIQEILIAQGYLSGPADGQAGPKTVKAAAAWRKDAGLPDGDLDPSLLNELRFMAPQHARQIAAASPTRNPWLAWAQEVLKERGYLSEPATGLPSTASTDALKKWQRDHAIAVDGAVGPETMKSLTDACSPTSPKPPAAPTSLPSPAASPAAQAPQVTTPASPAPTAESPAAGSDVGGGPAQAPFQRAS